MAISITVNPQVTQITSTSNNAVSLDITTSTTTVEAATTFYSRQNILFDADNVIVDPYKTLTATSVQRALEQLADQNFRGNTQPTGATLEVGDTWYDTANNIFYVYRTIDGITDWHPIINADVGKPDRLDGGAF